MSEHLGRWLEKSLIADAGPPPNEAFTILAQWRRYRETLEWLAAGDWVEGDPLEARDRAREAL